MELQLLASSLRSKPDYELIRGYIDIKLATYDKLFQIVMKKVDDYYRRDPDATAVDAAVLVAQIAESIRNNKHVARMSEMIDSALAASSSDVNVRAVILLAKQQEVADKLSQVLASGIGEPDGLIDELQAIRAMTSLEELEEQGLEVFHDVDLSALVIQEFDPANLIKLYPDSLNERIDGGAKRGHHVVVFAQVELGKTAFCVNLNAGFARQGLRSLYFINEDRPQDILIRHVSNLSGMNKREIHNDPERAQHIANENGFQNVIVVSCSPGTPRQIETYIDKYEPDCVLVDQLRNLAMKADNRVNQLEAAATAMRTIAKKKNVLMVSVTQAGDSASNKLILDKGDVDYSNVGIPAQADLMIGIGMDAAFEAEGLRELTLCKNKINGCHDSWPVRIITPLSRIRSV
jgi:archaellum biogenesis ATPase FlaH